jgi:hypothetical protein
MVQSTTFDAWLELVVAARSDDELRPAVASMTERFRDTVEATFRQIFPPPEQSDLFYEVAPRFAFALLDGLAVHRITATDPTRITEVLDALKKVAVLLMPQSAPEHGATPAPARNAKGRDDSAA